MYGLYLTLSKRISVNSGCYIYLAFSTLILVGSGVLFLVFHLRQQPSFSPDDSEPARALHEASRLSEHVFVSDDEQDEGVGGAWKIKAEPTEKPEGQQRKADMHGSHGASSANEQ